LFCATIVVVVAGVVVVDDCEAVGVFFVAAEVALFVVADVAASELLLPFLLLPRSSSVSEKEGWAVGHLRWR